MSLRHRDVQDPAAVRRAEMVRVAIVKDAIYCVWRVPRKNGPEEQRIEVSAALRNNLFGRVAFQTMLDNLATDTEGRITP